MKKFLVNNEIKKNNQILYETRLSPVFLFIFTKMSTTEQVKFCRKKQGPPCKTKYNLIIDREEYCEGKIEKYFEKNVEILKLRTEIGRAHV